MYIISYYILYCIIWYHIILYHIILYYKYIYICVCFVVFDWPVKPQGPEDSELSGAFWKLCPQHVDVLVLKKSGGILPLTRPGDVNS